MNKANEAKSITVEDVLASLEGESAQDAQTLIAIIQRISGHEPKTWHMGTIGFDSFHYKYDSGREGDSFIIGFKPKRAKITFYLMDGTVRHAALLKKLGKYTTTGYCLYIKRLSDIELPVLEQILQASYDYIKTLSKDGPVGQILWQAEK